MREYKQEYSVENRKAYYDYFVEETFEAGMELRGNEVKSIRDGSVSIKESWASIDNNEVFVKQMHITPWSKANSFDVEENRKVKLLLHKKEIRYIIGKLGTNKGNGYTLIPLKLYFNKGKCKMLLGLCKGKHNYDKRQAIKERDIARNIKKYENS